APGGAEVWADMACASADPVGEEQDDLVDREIADRGEEAKNGDRHDHDDGRVAQLGLGGPRGFLELVDHFAEEDAGAAERIFHSGIWQARRDSNPQPTVLETATLPIEL